MKITFCINELDPGGAERALVRIATGLARRGHECRVVSLRDRGVLAEPLSDAGISVTALEGAGRWSPAVLWRLAAELKRTRPDVLQCFLPQANLVGRLAGTLARVPVILSGIRVADQRSSWLHRLDRLTKRFVTKYVAVSRSVAAFHAAQIGVSPESVAVIPNGVDVAAIRDVPAADRAQFGIDASASVLLFVGRLDPQKAPRDLLDAFCRLPDDTRERSYLLLVGDGPLRPALEAACGREALKGRVRLLGYRDDAVALMKASDLLVLPSHWEGLPNVVLEAMAAGLPVVATRVDGTCELIEDGRTGRLVEPGRPDLLAQAILRGLTHREESLRWSEEAQHVAEKDFKWCRAVGDHEALYESLTSAATDGGDPGVP